MITTFSHLETRPRTRAPVGSRLGRFAAVLATVTCGLLAFVAAGPAAFARPVPPPVGSWTSVTPATVSVISTGGTPGWQIALVAIGAAVVAAATAILLNRMLIRRRGATAASA